VECRCAVDQPASAEKTPADLPRFFERLGVSRLGGKMWLALRQLQRCGFQVAGTSIERFGRRSN
jgi:hypothetical protein